jgi:hypothetical protein
MSLISIPQNLPQMTISISKHTIQRILHNDGTSIELYTNTNANPFLVNLEMVNALCLMSFVSNSESISQIKSVRIFCYRCHDIHEQTIFNQIIDFIKLVPSIEHITIDNVQEWIAFDDFIQDFFRKVLKDETDIDIDQNVHQSWWHMRRTIIFSGPVSLYKYGFVAIVNNGSIESLQFANRQKIDMLFNSFHGYTSSIRSLRLSFKQKDEDDLPFHLPRLANIIEKENFASTLRHIDLYYCAFDNHSNEFDHLRDALVNKCQHLQSVSFRECSFRDGTSIILKQLLSELRSCTKVSLLDNSYFETQVCFSYSKYGSTVKILQASFDCGNTTTGLESLVQLLTVLENDDTTLQELNLGCIKSWQNLYVFSQRIPNICCLTSFRVQFVGLTLENFRVLLNALQQNLSLTTICVDCPQLQHIITPKLHMLCNRNQLLKNLDAAIQDGTVPRKVLAPMIKSLLDANVSHKSLFRILLSSNAWTV